jgi:hypothetical protein
MADVSFRGFFSQRFEADLGPDETGGNRNDDSAQSLRSVTDLGTIITSRTPRTTLSFAPGVRGVLSTEDDASNNVVPRFNASLARLGPRHTLNVGLSFLPDFVTGSDFEETRRVDRNVIQYDANANAALTWRLDPVNSLSFNGFARLREYSETTRDFVPNTSVGAGTTWSRNLDERTTGNLSLRYSQFIPLEDTDNDRRRRSQTVSLSVGGDRLVTPDFRFGASIGTSFTDRFGTSSSGGSDLDVGLIGSVNARYDMTDRTFLTFGLSQDVAADSAGNPENRTSVIAGINSRLTETQSVGFTARFVTSIPLDSGDSGSGEDETSNRFELSPSYSIDLTPDWSARFAYALRFEDDEGDLGVSNRVTFSISRSLSFLP